MKHPTQTILALSVLFSAQTFGQITVSNLKKVVTNSTTVLALFNGYSKEHISNSGIIYYGNKKNSNTVAIEPKQGSNIVFYGFDNKLIYKQFAKEIDRIGVQGGCDVNSNINTEIDVPLDVECECNGYFYYLKMLQYNNIVAGYELKVAKAVNKKYIK